MESRPLPPPSNVNEHVSRFDPRAAAQEFEHELSPGMRDEPLPGVGMSSASSASWPAPCSPSPCSC